NEYESDETRIIIYKQPQEVHSRRDSNEFASIEKIEDINDILDYSTHSYMESPSLYTIVKKILKFAIHTLSRNNLWLVLVVILILLFDLHLLRAHPDEYTPFKVLFEVMSAFGNIGLSTVNFYSIFQ